MTATDELRRLLDERGVEWTAPNSCLRDEMTSWAARGFYYDAFEVPEPDGTFLLTAAHQDDLTPEQAVEATLGRGTCRMEKRHMDWRCTGCGEIVGTDDPTSELFIDGNAIELWRYCPNCGRRRVG